MVQCFKMPRVPSSYSSAALNLLLTTPFLSSAPVRSAHLIASSLSSLRLFLFVHSSFQRKHLSLTLTLSTRLLALVIPVLTNPIPSRDTFDSSETSTTLNPRIGAVEVQPS